MHVSHPIVSAARPRTARTDTLLHRTYRPHRTTTVPHDTTPTVSSAPHPPPRPLSPHPARRHCLVPTSCTAHPVPPTHPPATHVRTVRPPPRDMYVPYAHSRPYLHPALHLSRTAQTQTQPDTAGSRPRRNRGTAPHRPHHVLRPRYCTVRPLPSTGCCIRSTGAHERDIHHHALVHAHIHVYIPLPNSLLYTHPTAVMYCTSPAAQRSAAQRGTRSQTHCPHCTLPLYLRPPKPAQHAGPLWLLTRSPQPATGVFPRASSPRHNRSPECVLAPRSPRPPRSPSRYLRCARPLSPRARPLSLVNPRR